MHKSFLMERAGSLEILLADVIAMRKETLKVRSLKLADPKGSNGEQVSACSTSDRSQEYCVLEGVVNWMPLLRSYVPSDVGKRLQPHQRSG